MFKHWLINIATSGMTKEQKKEVEKAVEDSEEVENMRYNLERAIKSEFEKIEFKLKEAKEERGKSVVDSQINLANNLRIYTYYDRFYQLGR